jgi:hypothetical protein
MRPITIEPNPLRCGDVTGGPLLSVQLMMKAPWPTSQEISMRPTFVDSAPYFPALVARSWSARPIACAQDAFRRSLGPFAEMRMPVGRDQRRERLAKSDCRVAGSDDNSIRKIAFDNWMRVFRFTVGAVTGTREIVHATTWCG